MSLIAAAGILSLSQDMPIPTTYGAHAYWRLYGGQSGIVSSDTGLSAMAFKDASGSSIATTGGTAIESDHFSTFAVAALFDGNNATFWESDTAGIVPWAGYHFGSAVSVMQIGLQKAASMDGSVCPGFAFVQWSDDGLAWTTVGSVDCHAGLIANDTMVWFDLTPGLTTLYGARPDKTHGSHVYWRVLGGETNLLARGFAAYSAMGFKDKTGSTISASGGTVIESDHSSTFAGSSVFDGNNATFWESGNGADVVPYIGYQFATAQEVAQIGLQKASSMDGSSPANLALFQFSDDGRTWFTAQTALVALALAVNDTMVWFDLATFY